jgi:hypothetical protein
MAIGLTFDEYIELKLMPPKHSERAFVTAAEHMRDKAFPMSLFQVAWYMRTRGYDCRPFGAAGHSGNTRSRTRRDLGSPKSRFLNSRVVYWPVEKRRVRKIPTPVNNRATQNGP